MRISSNDSEGSGCRGGGGEGDLPTFRTSTDDASSKHVYCCITSRSGNAGILLPRLVEASKASLKSYANLAAVANI